MLFSVKVVSREEYDAHVEELEAAGQSRREAAAGRRRGLHPSRPRGERIPSDRHRGPPRHRGPDPQAPGPAGRPGPDHADHKLIGKLYLGTSFAWFLIAGLMAMIMRTELALPGEDIVNDETYNQLFTMHGTIMLLLFATPLFFGFGNVVMPLQIGSPDVAFPRLNMFSYWLFLFGGIIAGSGFLTPTGAADFGCSPTRRCPTPSDHQASVATSGSWASGWPVSAPSSARSTSSPRSSACGRPA